MPSAMKSASRTQREKIAEDSLKSRKNGPPPTKKNIRKEMDRLGLRQPSNVR